MNEKEFDRWNQIKKKINNKIESLDPFPKEGMVWICVVGKNVGYEQNGVGMDFARPVLVVKKFNNKMYWVLPLSTKQKEYDFYYNFIDPFGMKGSIILAQLRLISVKRFIRDMYEIDTANFDAIRLRLIEFLMQSKPRTRRGFSRPFGTL